LIGEFNISNKLGSPPPYLYQLIYPTNFHDMQKHTNWDRLRIRYPPYIL